jgi:hypothetical protein
MHFFLTLVLEFKFLRRYLLENRKINLKILDNISNRVSLIVTGVVASTDAEFCFLFERCVGGSDICNQFCKDKLGKPGGKCSADEIKCCCHD